MRTKTISADQYELDFSGVRMKEAAIATILSHNEAWAHLVRQEFKGWIGGKPPGFRFTGEEFRMHVLTNTKIGHPNHHNAWGALFGHLPKYGPVFMVNETTLSKDPRSHARRAMIWERTQ